MSIVAERYKFVIGVDTHAATHSLALVTAATGAHLDEAVFPNTVSGWDRAWNWIARRIDGQSALVVIEGIGSYGAGLAERVSSASLPVAEPPAIPRRSGAVSVRPTRSMRSVSRGRCWPSIPHACGSLGPPADVRPCEFWSSLANRWSLSVPG